MGELDFIAWLREQLDAPGAANRRLPVPPGDDCAVVEQSGAQLLFAADMLMAGVHFDLSLTTPRLAGRKALAVNLSDIAAMAGTPTAATVSLALPRQAGQALGREVMAGIIALANEYGVAVAGGDTNSWNGPLVIAVSILGEPHPRGSVTRAGARPDDWICVTGELGGSIGGRHLSFAPRLREARLLHDRYGLNAMIDLSDGLGSDLRHILRESGASARLARGAVPIAAAAAGSLKRALADGEDFELCFTLPAAAARRLLAEQPFAPALRVSHIGQVTPATAGAPELVWEDGAPVVETGYRHEMD